MVFWQIEHGETLRQIYLSPSGQLRSTTPRKPRPIRLSRNARQCTSASDKRHRHTQHPAVPCSGDANGNQHCTVHHTPALANTLQ